MFDNLNQPAPLQNPGLGLDLDRFGMEVANEIGVNPGTFGAHGLTAKKIREYESALHSGTQRGGAR